MAKPKQNKIFYSDDESSEEEEGLVRCSSGYPRTKETGGEQHPILVQGPTEDRSFAANKAPESNRYKKNEATAPPKPRVGDPAAQKGTVNLGTETGEEDRAAPSTAPVRHATCLLEGLTRMTLREQVKLEMRLTTLERRLRETDERVRIRDQKILQMQRQLAAPPGPTGGPQTSACPPRHQHAPHAAQRRGTRKTFSCHFCNFLVGTHDTEHCYKNPQRVACPISPGKGRAKS